MKLRLGTRGSRLARWQAEWVARRLRNLPDAPEVEMVLITTSGDRLQRGPIEATGPPGVFTKEIQRALQEGEVDLAVHSLKDLPTDETPGLCLAAVPERGPHDDVLLSNRCDRFGDLPGGAVVGTGSLRRRAQLLHARPDLAIEGIRGNVETRIQKLDAGQFDAIVLAEAGLVRLGLHDRITERLAHAVCMPAVGQGALAIETREDDDASRAVLARLNDQATWTAVLAERAMLAALQGGCLAPIASWGRFDGDRFVLTGRVLDANGRQAVETQLEGDPERPQELGLRVAEDLHSQGARQLIEASRAGGS